MDRPRLKYALTHDAMLHLHVPDAAARAIVPWLPINVRTARAGDRARCTIEIAVGPVRGVAPALARIARIHGTTVYDDGAAGLVLFGPGIHGRLVPRDGRARIVLAGGDVAFNDVAAAMNLAAAALLAGQGRYLVHAAAVRSASGVVLLAGDAFAGKTTTALNLARAGWPLLSDDHVVLSRANGAWRAEGWPRASHVDSGWPEAAPTGRRVALDPATLAPFDGEGAARVHAVLLPSVAPGAQTTSAAPAQPSAVLAMLLRQSAWSLIDREAAGGALECVTDLAARPSADLRLAPDTFGDPQRLRSIVEHAIARSAA
jgi:hypothetical protein